MEKLNTKSAMWHPCSQMKDYETLPPLHIASAEGSYITLQMDNA